MAKTIPTTAHTRQQGFDATGRQALLHAVLAGTLSMDHCLERFLDYLEQTS